MYKFIFVVKLGALGRKFIWQLYKKSAEKIPKPVFSARGESFKFWLPVEEEGLDFVRFELHGDLLSRNFRRAGDPLHQIALRGVPDLKAQL